MADSLIESLEIRPASDQSLLVYLGEEISLDTHERVVALLRLLEAEPISGVRNLHPAYSSILVDFDASKLTHEELAAILHDYVARSRVIRLPNTKEVEIPVCYDGEFGIDLKQVAALHEIAPAQVVELHVSVAYVVYFLGFVPGFAYLGELPEQLATPRLPAPRRNTPPGSVGIADRQTGVYPFDTPGGWRIIGRTPLSMFRPDRQGMSSLVAGDRVRFTPISAERFRSLQKP